MALNDGRVVPAFLDQALRGKDLTVFGDGSQTRSFCYVSDLVNGLLMLIESGEPYPVNLGNPIEMTILEFAQYIRDRVDENCGIEFRPLPSDDPNIRPAGYQQSEASTWLGAKGKFGRRHRLHGRLLQPEGSGRKNSSAEVENAERHFVTAASLTTRPTLLGGDNPRRNLACGIPRNLDRGLGAPAPKHPAANVTSCFIRELLACAEEDASGPSMLLLTITGP